MTREVTTRSPLHDYHHPMIGAREFVQGHGHFTDDIRLPGLLHARFVRSVLAHAELTAIDISGAANVNDVVAVLVADDLPLGSIPGEGRHGPPAPHMARPPLARERVRYVGEPIALVISSSPATAEDAAEAVQVEYEELPAVIDPFDAADGGSLLFADAGTNVVHQSASTTGDAPECEVVATVEVLNQRVAPLALEPLGLVADPRAGRLRIWCGHQAPHRLRKQLANLLSLPERTLRVTVPNVGGGFGGKGMFYPEYAVVAAAALRLGQPIKWVATRREDLAGGVHGRAQRHRVTLRGDRSGRIAHARFEILADMGAYPHNGSMIPGFTRYMATGPYRIESVETSTTLVVTNTAPIGTYRGAGRPEATYALERAIDAYARGAGLDPIDVRRINLIDDDSFPYETFSGGLYDSGTYRTALEKIVDEAGLDDVRRDQIELEQTDQPMVGAGIAFYLERAGGPINEGEHATVAIDEDGVMTVSVGAVDTGQGHAGLWRSIAGQVFDMEHAHIRVISGDTDQVAEGVGTFASRSTQVCGTVVQRCAEKLLEKARRVAASLLEAAPADLRPMGGRIAVVDDSGSSIDLRSISERAREMGIKMSESETWVPGAHTFPYGAHAAVVEVDRLTGDVRLKRAVAVDDCGNVLNAAGALGQVHGSLAQGIGQARYEGVRYGDDGQLLTATLVDYLAPRAPDLPMFETFHLTSPAPSNPLGAKGIGESGCIGFPAAFVAAVADAIGHPPSPSCEMPMHSETVWRWMREGDATQTNDPGSRVDD